VPAFLLKKMPATIFYPEHKKASTALLFWLILLGAVIVKKNLNRACCSGFF